MQAGLVNRGVVAVVIDLDPVVVDGDGHLVNLELVVVNIYRHLLDLQDEGLDVLLGLGEVAVQLVVLALPLTALALALALALGVDDLLQPSNLAPVDL